MNSSSWTAWHHSYKSATGRGYQATGYFLVMRRLTGKVPMGGGSGSLAIEAKVAGGNCFQHL